MNVSLRIERAQAYLYAIVTGVFSLAGARRVSLRILGTCDEHGLRKILLDIRALQGTMSTVDDFEWAAFLATEHTRRMAQGLAPLRFVILGNRPLLRPAGPARKAAGEVAEDHFGETVMVNRGLDARSTTDPGQAVEWLGIRPAREDGGPQAAARHPEA
jgi:hypothetical protein